MIIESIILENFRQFKGKHQIIFSADSVANVTVVMGENGAGKTTVEQAFTWCLYGKNTFTDKELLNREVRNAMPVGDSVNVEAVLKVRNNNQRYKISRRQIVNKKSGVKCTTSEAFMIEVQNQNGKWEEMPKLIQARAIVEEMLSQNLSDFFFFDGERIAAMSKDLLQKRRSDEFKNAVRALVGLDVLKATKDIFGPDTRKRTVTGNLLVQIGSNDSDKLSEMSDQIDKLENEIQKLNGDKNLYSMQLENIQQKLVGYEVDLKGMQESINNGEKYSNRKKQIDNEEKQKAADEVRALKYFSKNIFSILLQPLLLSAIKEIPQQHKLNLGVPHIHAKTIEYLLKQGRCICGTDLHDNPACIKALENLKQGLPPYSLNKVLADFTKDVRTNAKDYIREATNISETFTEYAQNALGHDEKIKWYEKELQLLEKQLPDQKRIAILNQNKKEAECIKSKLKRDFESVVGNISIKSREKERLQRKRNEIISTNERNINNNLYYRYALAVYNELEKEYSEKEKNTRENLERIINEIFSNIYNGRIGIRINDDYLVKTYLHDNELDGDLEKNTAQSYAVIFAFIAGIIKMHFEDKKNKNDGAINEDDGLPLVMDAPLSAFDKDRIRRICEELPQIAKQVIIFIKDTDGDIAEEYMNSVIGKKWQLLADSETSSRIVERN